MRILPIEGPILNGHHALNQQCEVLVEEPANATEYRATVGRLQFSLAALLTKKGNRQPAPGTNG